MQDLIKVGLARDVKAIMSRSSVKPRKSHMVSRSVDSKQPARVVKPIQSRQPSVHSSRQKDRETANITVSSIRTTTTRHDRPKRSVEFIQDITNLDIE